MSILPLYIAIILHRDIFRCVVCCNTVGTLLIGGFIVPAFWALLHVCDEMTDKPFFTCVSSWTVLTLVRFLTTVRTLVST